MNQYIIIGDGYSQTTSNYYLCTDGYNSSSSNYLILGQSYGSIVPPVNPFVPTQLANLALWLRADLGITLNSTNVSVWADQSGNSNNFTASAGNQPPYNATTGINNLPSIDTSGTGTTTHYLQCVNAMNVILTGVAAERFIVLNANTQTNGVMTENWGAGDDGSFFPYVGDGNLYDGFAQTGRPSCGTLTTNAPIILDTQSAAGNFTELVNTATLYTTGTNTFAPGTNPPYLFGVPALGYWNGKLSEIIVYNRILTSDERTQVITYLSTRYGITV